jgi:hypothetical protein
VHWGVGLFLGNGTTARTVDYLRRFEGSAVGGAFMLGPDGPAGGQRPVTESCGNPTFAGSVATFSPIYQVPTNPPILLLKFGRTYPYLQYGPPNATAAALAINAVPADGCMVYVYLGLGSDMAV